MPAKDQSASSSEPRINLPEVTVSELSTSLKRTIEDAYGYVRVRGELGGVKYHSSGHVYLDLKDDRACLAGVIWKTTASRLRIKLEAGLEVSVTGRITTFPGQSKYQIVIDTIEPAGLGALMALLEERKKQLAAEGLFDEARKQLLPYLPRVIGVITSPTGAVIRDILHRLADRFPREVLVWKENRDAPVVPVRTILNTPGLLAVLFLSVMSVTAIDLIVVYLPILGIERGIDVKNIGLLLSVRACASIVSRLFYARMIRFVGRHPLMVSSSFGGAIGFVMLALPVPMWVLVAAVIIVGFTLGIASTLSITGTIDLVGAAGRGTANTLRIMGNRLGQVGMPTLAGLIATAFGVGGVFMIIAGTLAAATASIVVSRPRR